MAMVDQMMGAPGAQPRILRLGIAGLGVASTLFLPGVEQFPHARIAAAADRRRSALEAFERKYQGRAYGSVEELCVDPQIDVIWVATPNQFHCRHTVMAAKNGKHVIRTKPMALTVEECEEMCLAAERNGVKLLCGQTYSMSPDIQAMWQVARSGELGRLIAINSWLSIPVHGGRGAGLIEMKEMYEALIEDKPITHDGRWALATLEVGNAIVQSVRERREIMLAHQCGLPT